MIRGQYFHIIDDKGRVTMPTKMRDVITEKFNNNMVLTHWEGYLLLFPSDEWRNLEEKVSHQAVMGEREVRTFQRFFVSGAVDCSLDSAGRISLPPNLREYAAIKKDVVIVGMGRVIEIWGKERFVEEMKKAEQLMGEYGEHISKLGV